MILNLNHMHLLLLYTYMLMFVVFFCIHYIKTFSPLHCAVPTVNLKYKMLLIMYVFKLKTKLQL